ncbi:HD family phosphohydrolase [Halobacillus mangrovi]|uniref:HD/PDEase domain-containing protein n=1 Tax=Halobacillus mangrovi TaxID=402384 RepID=A0A1W5ZUR5_9BACI|nr:HDIG domain-containing metalloprotein [Halobacillus mangrovi]ARI77025.1 hypothetical protein HM131_09300 [Halobacillus mangrovi]
MNKISEFFTNLTIYRERTLLFILSVGIVTLFFFLSLSNIYTPTYHLEKYNPAPETIRAPFTVENERKTEELIREATQAVEDRYTISEDIEAERIEIISEVFAGIKEVKSSSGEGASVEEELATLKSYLPDELTQDLPEGIFEAFMRADTRELENAESLLLSSLKSVFSEGIRSEDVEDAERTIALKVQYSSLSVPIKQAATDLGRFSLVENAFFDAELTEEARKEAAAGVDPVLIRSGEVIVTQGSTLTNEIMEELQLTGLLTGQKNGWPMLGLALFCGLLACIVLYESLKARKRNMTMRQIGVLAIISAFTLLLMKVCSLFVTIDQPYYFLIPAAAGAMLIKLLCDERLAIAMSIVYSLMACLLFNGQIAGVLNAQAGMYTLMSQLASIIFLVQYKDRSAVVRAGASVAFINICMITFFSFISFERYSWVEWSTFIGYGALAALFSVVLTLGVLPLIETGFGILSDQQLLNLSNPNHPLLRKILVEAPGTYHHSVMVANLSEAACESIGANGLLARVASYYHDVGKTIRPNYFIENQMGMRNPHDFLDPEQSAEIIIAHPYDGAKLLKEKKIPKEIIAIAEQHHGTTLLKYFYYQAKNESKHVEESEYRYPGPKPQTIEAAIVNICDSVEAAVRSLNEPTEEKINQIVQGIIENRLLDGQFEECDLTLKQLKVLEQAICETLNGIFHSRIQYPDAKTLVKEAK